MPKRVETGTVTSAAASKTRRVEIPRIVRHPKYGRILHRRTVCHVHDEAEESEAGRRAMHGRAPARAERGGRRRTTGGARFHGHR